MTRDREQLERELAQHLSETAGSPRPDASTRIRRRIAAAPQRRGWLVRLGAMAGSPAWTRAGALVAVAAAALLVGIYIGQVGLPIQVGPSSSPLGSATADVSPVESGRPEPSAPASPAPGMAMSYAVWERIDMPDPAPGVFGGGTPSSVVAFNGGYVAVGTIFTECCAEADPAANVGVIWTSTNGVEWQLVDVGDTFEHATLGQVVTDGERLVATGVSAGPSETAPTGAPIPAAWVSDDGRHWQRVAAPVPTGVLASGDGFVGVGTRTIRRLDSQSIRFMTSADGLEWRDVANGDVERVVGLAAASNGRLLVVAVVRGADRADGSETKDLIAWSSDDGTAWEGPVVVATDASASPPIGLSAATAWQDQFMVVGQRDDPARGSIGLVWISPEGVNWTEHEVGSADGETLTGVFAAGHAVVAVGDSLTSGATADIVAWVSEDGVRWARVPEQPGFEGINNHVEAVIETPDGLLAVGRRWDPESGHPLPQAWIASDDPMVWLEATSDPGAEIGVDYDFTFGHCGLQSPVDFDGSLWVPAGSDYVLPPVPLDMLDGTMRLTGPDTAIFEDSASNWALALSRHDGPNAYPLCD